MPEKGIKIREATDSDLREIYHEGLAEPLFKEMNPSFTANNLADLFTSRDVIVFVAVRSKKVLGFILGSINNNECRIEWIIVKKGFRKKGIGTKMLNLLIENTKNSGADHFFIAVFMNNSESVNFFNKSGFTVKRTVLEFYRNSDENFIQG